MNTPICDFVKKYAESSSLRLHMPGHKGAPVLGMESLDITEFDGADSLYEAKGIIKESEENASRLFSAHTFYSAEGSSLSIKAMLYLAMLYGAEKGRKPLIAAGRNAHKAFLNAAALLDFDILWLYPEEKSSYLSCVITADSLKNALDSAEEKPVAVYITSPDYLGNITDIKALSKVCRERNILLIVDNAHGAYLGFLTENRHPIHLGADMCCDSAHKTLPVLTGGGYLHINKNAPALFAEKAKDALALFGSTSPSYLILQSLDMANKYLESYPALLGEFVPYVKSTKKSLSEAGFTLIGNEDIKITVYAPSYGYSGTELAEYLKEQGIMSEFYDPEHIVFMVTPETGKDGLYRLEKALLSLPKKSPLRKKEFSATVPRRVMTPRQAAFSPSETVPANMSAGRVLASPSVGCPPAVPIVMCGERIEKEHAEMFEHYGIEKCTVIKEASL